MLNKQIPLKQELRSDTRLSVNSIFYTIQGEGPFAGSPCIFVRLAGCNLQCPKCDTQYSELYVESSSEIQKSIEHLWPHRTHDPDPLVVITGGEPFRQNIKPLVEGLLSIGFRVQIETNGTLFVKMSGAHGDPRFTIVCSPKAGKVNKDLEPYIDAYKYVLNADSVDPEDGLPILALGHTASPRVARPPSYFDGSIFIQPIDVGDGIENERHLKAAVDSAMKHNYRLCLQVHKYIGVR